MIQFSAIAVGAMFILCVATMAKYRSLGLIHLRPWCVRAMLWANDARAGLSARMTKAHRWWLARRYPVRSLIPSERVLFATLSIPMGGRRSSGEEERLDITEQLRLYYANDDVLSTSSMRWWLEKCCTVEDNSRVFLLFTVGRRVRYIEFSFDDFDDATLSQIDASVC